MSMSFLAPALTEEEKVFLSQQKNSEHFRVYAKALTYLYSLEAAKMATCEPALLLRFQGAAQGLLIAKNILCLGQMSDPKK